MQRAGLMTIFSQRNLVSAADFGVVHSPNVIFL